MNLSEAKLPAVLWFTGLSGAGKSTIADLVYRSLAESGIPIERLDGDAVREVFPQTGFSREERNMHIRRMGFIAGLLEKHGVTVVCSFISPYQESRDFVRSICRNFIEIHVSTPLRVCEARDVKGLYKKARDGHIKQFTGLDDPYEEPKSPEINVNTEGQSPEVSAASVMRYFGT